MGSSTAAAAAAAAKTEKEAQQAFTSGSHSHAEHTVPHSGQASHGLGSITPTASAGTPVATAAPTTPTIGGGIIPNAAVVAAAAARKRKNVTLATLALLYDPPVEGCELKPYVLLKYAAASD